MNNYILMAFYPLITAQVFIILPQTWELNIRRRYLLNAYMIGMQLMWNSFPFCSFPFRSVDLNISLHTAWTLQIFKAPSWLNGRANVCLASGMRFYIFLSTSLLMLLTPLVKCSLVSFLPVSSSLFHYLLIFIFPTIYINCLQYA